MGTNKFGYLQRNNTKARSVDFVYEKLNFQLTLIQIYMFGSHMFSKITSS